MTNWYKRNGIQRRAWKRTRGVVLARAEGRCEGRPHAGRLTKTAERCDSPATDVDHIVRLDDGGAKYDLDNLQALCQRCHFIKSASERRAPLSPDEERRRDEWEEFTDRLRKQDADDLD